jgi:cellulose synthase/poly-beta-1,6-N-acetylglucosamine synthase-like glycosyltransferase
MYLQIISILFLIPAGLVCLYYVFLAIYAVLKKQHISLSKNDAAHTFAIVIPAHNEENVIKISLHSCDQLDYPKDKYRVFVIADNCTDRTAEVAVQNQAVSLERQDETNRGKGYALAWAFERILPEEYDAVIVLDADCQIDSHALRVFDRCLGEGYRVLQANDRASNPDVSPISYAVAVGNLIENDLFYAPKSALRWAVFLRGTGMVFHREILETYTWQAHSIAEDIEYSLRLLREGIRIKFVGDVHVSSEFPADTEQLKVQRGRWSVGNLSFGKKQALKLIVEGLANRQWPLIDAGWSLLVLSRPLVLLELVLAVASCLICFWLVPGPVSTALFLTALVIVCAQTLYFGMGIVLLGMTARRIKLLLQSPTVVLRLTIISVLGILGITKAIWARTPR